MKYSFNRKRPTTHQVRYYIENLVSKKKWRGAFINFHSECPPTHTNTDRVQSTQRKGRKSWQKKIMHLIRKRSCGVEKNNFSIELLYWGTMLSAIYSRKQSPLTFNCQRVHMPHYWPWVRIKNLSTSARNFQNSSVYIYIDMNWANIILSMMRKRACIAQSWQILTECTRPRHTTECGNSHSQMLDVSRSYGAQKKYSRIYSYS